MSGVFGNIGKRLSDTLENAHKEIQQALIPNTSSPSHETKAKNSNGNGEGGGHKSRLFGTILGRSQRMRDSIVDRRNPKHLEGSSNLSTPTKELPAGVERDDVQEKLALFARLEKEFCDLIEAYEILLDERKHLEIILTQNGQLDSLDDLDLISQYYRAQQATQLIAKKEIQRLTEENEKLKLQLTSKEIHVEETQEDSVDEERSSKIFELESELRRREAKEEASLTDLQSQKLALETKVAYLQSQLADYAKLREKYQRGKMEWEQKINHIESLLSDAINKQKLAETEMINMKNSSKVAWEEIGTLRSGNESIVGQLQQDKKSLEAIITVTEGLLEEEIEKRRALAGELTRMQDQICQLKEELKIREGQILQLKRNQSIDSFYIASNKSSTTTFSPEVAKNDNNSSVSLEQSTEFKTLRRECEKLALENSRLKTTNQQEYLRNVMLKYLQLPEQRKSLLPVIASILRFNEEEMTLIKK